MYTKRSEFARSLTASIQGERWVPAQRKAGDITRTPAATTVHTASGDGAPLEAVAMIAGPASAEEGIRTA